MWNDNVPYEYASGQISLMFREYRPGLHVAEVLWAPVQQSSGWLNFAQVEKQGLNIGRTILVLGYGYTPLPGFSGGFD